jgi:hypothetical protein
VSHSLLSRLSFVVVVRPLPHRVFAAFDDDAYERQMTAWAV